MFIRTLLVVVLVFVSFASNSQSKKRQIEQAEELTGDGKHSEALGIVNKILIKDSLNYDALVVRGLVYNNLNEIQKSYDDLTKAIKIAPDSAKGYFFRGLVLYRTMNSEESIYDYTQAIELTNDDFLRATIYSNRGNAKTQRRDFQGGFEDYSRAYIFDTTNLEVLNNMAIALDELGRRDESMAYLKKIIKLKPEFLGGWINLGYQHSKIGKYKEAVEYLDQALRIQKDEPVALNNRGYAKYMLKDYTGALDDINKSISLYPDNSYAYRNRALVYLAQSQNEKACKDIQEALRAEFTKVYGDEVLELQKKYCK